MTRRFNWLNYDDNECDWNSLKAAPCNLDGQLEFLGLLNDPNLQGTLPPEVALLTQLKELSIVDCGLAGTANTVLPVSVAEGLAPSLRKFSVEGNALTGPLPVHLSLLTNLQQLQLMDNFWSGSVPTELGLLTRLTQLDISNTALTGAVPQEVCALPLLDTLEADCLELACCPANE